MLGGTEDMAIPVEMSARHVHLTPEDVQALFGRDAQLTLKRNLPAGGFSLKRESQHCDRQGCLSKCSCIGTRKRAYTSRTICSRCLCAGNQAPVNISGDFTGAEDVYLIGSHGMIYAKNSAIIAQAHIHLSQEEAEQMGLADRDLVRAELEGRRPLIMNNVMIRVGEGMHAMMHIDMDEANASGYDSAKRARIRK